MILVSIHAQRSRNEFKVQRWKQLETIFSNQKNLRQMCCKIVQWLLILRPRHRYLIAHQLALQVRVDGQSSSDTGKKKWITLT